jgi:hypothetical protein
MMAKESFDLADVVGASRLRELERDAFPARYFFAQLSPGVHITRYRVVSSLSQTRTIHLHAGHVGK